MWNTDSLLFYSVLDFFFYLCLKSFSKTSFSASNVLESWSLFDASGTCSISNETIVASNIPSRGNYLVTSRAKRKRLAEKSPHEENALLAA